MKGFILAAGLGTRLKPWTDYHPKALAPVGGVPMLQRVVENMHAVGIRDITVNVFHFADQIIDFISSKSWNINISDERPELLETGGALLHASSYLEGDEPILVHNADIISNADFSRLEQAHLSSDSLATLLVSDRQSSRRLIFNSDFSLVGWHSIAENRFRPGDFIPAPGQLELAFSGIYVVSPKIFNEMSGRGFTGRFPIMDLFLTSLDTEKIQGYWQHNLELIDIGKPDSLNRANSLYI